MKIKPRASVFCAPFVAGLAMLWPSIHLFADELHSNPAPLQQLADVFEASYAEETPPEGAKMLLAILRGSRMGPGEGWFGPSQSRYDFAWLVEQHGGSSESIPRSRFAGSGELFAVLDRNRDGVIEDALKLRIIDVELVGLPVEEALADLAGVAGCVEEHEALDDSVLHQRTLDCTTHHLGIAEVVVAKHSCFSQSIGSGQGPWWRREGEMGCDVRGRVGPTQRTISGSSRGACSPRRVG